MKAKLNRLIDICACILLLAGLVAGLGYALRATKEINEYENRYAEKIGTLDFETYLSSEFQDSVEAGLADQLPLGITAKEKYNDVFSGYKTAVYDSIQQSLTAKASAEAAADSEEPAEVSEALLSDEEVLEKERDLAAEYAAAAEARREEMRRQAIAKARGVRTEGSVEPGFLQVKIDAGKYLYNDNIYVPYRELEKYTERLDAKAENYNAVMQQYPDPEYYMYYIETEMDIDFSTGEHSLMYEYLAQQLNTPEENEACFMLNSFSEYDSYFYKTDHHWNYRGAYTAYKNLLAWLLPDETHLTPVGTLDVGITRGSYATGSLSDRTEVFTAYEFDFSPSVTVKINGANAASYGNQDKYIANAKDGNTSQFFTYGQFYGGDSGEIIFSNPDSANGSILIFGESYDNALLRLLAEHFTTVYSIDLRNYEAQTGKAFSYENYLASHDIDRVLFIGSNPYWIVDTFNLE